MEESIKNSNIDENRSEEISLLFIYKTLIRSKLFISTFTLFFTFISILYCFLAKPVWRGSFNIVVRDKNQSFESNGNFFSNSFSSQLLNSQSKNKTERLILISPSVLMPVYNSVKNNNDIQVESFNQWRKNLEVKFENNTQVLIVKYKNKDKKLLLNTLEKISNQYKLYSKRDKQKNLDQTISFLEKQEAIMKKKASQSMKNLNTFSIENGLGDVDGFVKLNSTNLNTLSGRSFNQSLDILNKTNLNNLAINNLKQEKSGAGQRYQKQFALLEKYEAEYVDLSSKLRENSIYLKSLKEKISNIKESLKRPNEILITFKELKSIAGRDEGILREISQNLQVIKLEKIKSLNPWEMISIPTLEESPAHPMKSQIVIISFILSLTTASLIAFLKEKFSGIIFDFEIIKDKLNTKYIDTIYISFPQMGRELIINEFFKELTKGEKRKIGIINFSSYENIQLLSILKLNKNSELSFLNLNEVESINKFSKIIFFIEEGKISSKEIIILNQISNTFKDTSAGWFLIDTKTNI